MITQENATHLFCGKHYCIKAVGNSGVTYKFNENVPLQELAHLQATYTGKHFYELKPNTEESE